MTAPLLQTKLYVPPVRPELVSRPRLTARLNAGLHRKLTLVSAPAGFGKTTLLSEWIHRRGGVTPPLRVAWLSLDEGDNDLGHFLAYVVAALQTVEEHFGESTLAALRSPQPPPIEALLTALINEVAALPQGDGASRSYLLVLDDYHVIRASPIHDALAFLLDHLPPQMHLVMATRADPPLPLARLRVRSELTELRAADLRFTPDEAAAFLNEAMGLDLSPEEITALEARTEGWIAGLQVAALSMQGREDTAAFIRAFTGSHRYILDYLVEEVLERQPPDVQGFLLKTSILDRLSGPLCDAVWKSDVGDWKLEGDHYPTSDLQPLTSSKGILEHLERANLFIVPLDDRREWYRYHRLFADPLRARLREQAGEQAMASLHRRASIWYEQQGVLDDAVRHAIAAGDLARVGKMIETHGMAMLLRGELTTLHHWIAALPEAMIVASARISALHAWVLLLIGQVNGVEPRLRQAEQALAKAPDQVLSGDIAAIRAYAAALQGDVPRTIELAHMALQLLDEQSMGERGVVFFALGGAHLLQGDSVAAAEAMRQASVVGQRDGNIHIAVPALNALASIQMQQGRLHQARATAAEALRLAIGPSGHPLPIAAGALSALAELACERNDLDNSLAQARQSVELSQRWGNSDTRCGCHLTLAEVLRARGDLAAARDALQEAEWTCREVVVTPHLLTLLRTDWALLHLAQGDLVAAARWVEEVALGRPDPLHAAEVLAWARLRLALGQPDAALPVLLTLLEMARAQGLNGVLIKALALRALAYQAQEAEDHALATLREALTLAEPEGYVRTFVDEGQPMAALLRRAADRGIAPQYVRQLLAAFSAMEPPPYPHTQPLIEPLSDRELEVLRLVAAGLSNQEIARQLIIAVSTVKSHLNAIFGKLAVKNRTQAVAQARGLGLL